MTKTSRLVSLLRGVNVGGKNRVKMDVLKSVYHKLGLTNVDSYIQSGNIVFTASAQSPAELESVLSRAIQEELLITTPVLIRTNEDIEAIIKNCPFEADSGENSRSLYVTLLQKSPGDNRLDRGVSKNGDSWIRKDREVYLNCSNGYSDTEFTNAGFEKLFGVKATSRNWRTLNKLAELSSADSG